ncbi:putative phage protein (TIGR02218 family) [Rhizobium sp. PP-F2F-G36]|nr:putative phage protein (TIGR02218 family) [Rhizobium sp. PP-F2F-G36]
MREIPDALAAHLAGDATTVCHGWRVTRRDGVVIGFTEHDRDLRFAGTDFLAASGFRASETEAAAGLAADAGEVTGGFSSAAISEADVAAGRYDGARVEQFLVNWQAPEQHMLLTVQDIGEVTRAGGAFRAELRSLTHRLGEVQGRSYGRRCDAAFGDARCGASLAGRSETGVILEVAGDVGLRVSGLSAAVGAYRYGLIRMTSGANAGWTCDVEDHIAGSEGAEGDGAGGDGATARLTLWLPPPVPLSAGDTLTVTMGCDKSFATCRDRFANALNFRGFPHMPGSDFSYGYADGETVHDGRPLFA